MIIIFAIITIISVLYTILTPNTVYSICSLAIAFISISAIYLLLGFDYLALTILIIYVGAIAILFLFIVMLLNIKIIEINILKLKKQLPFGIIIILIFFLQIINIIYNLYNLNDENNNIINSLTLLEYIYYFENNVRNLNIFGNLIYTSFSFFIIIASLILLLSMISAIILTYKKKINTYNQIITLQIYRNNNKTIKQVK